MDAASASEAPQNRQKSDVGSEPPWHRRQRRNMASDPAGSAEIDDATRLDGSGRRWRDGRRSRRRGYRVGQGVGCRRVNGLERIGAAGWAAAFGTPGSPGGVPQHGRGWEARLGEQVAAGDAESQAPRIPVAAERARRRVLARRVSRALGATVRVALPAEVNLRCRGPLRRERCRFERWGRPRLGRRPLRPCASARRKAGDRRCWRDATGDPLTALLAVDEVGWIVPAALSANHATGWDNGSRGTVKVCPQGTAQALRTCPGLPGQFRG